MASSSSRTSTTAASSNAGKIPWRGNKYELPTPVFRGQHRDLTPEDVTEILETKGTNVRERDIIHSIKPEDRTPSDVERLQELDQITRSVQREVMIKKRGKPTLSAEERVQERVLKQKSFFEGDNMARPQKMQKITTGPLSASSRNKAKAKGDFVPSCHSRET